MKKYIFKDRVHYDEVDKLKVVHNARYFIFFEKARTALARHAGCPYSDIEKMGVIFPVSKSFADFLKPMRYDEEYTIEVWLDYVRQYSMKFCYVIKNNNKEIICKGYTVLGSLNIRDNEFTEIPSDFSNSIKDFIKEKD